MAMKKQFCIVHSCVESTCDCPPEVAGQQELLSVVEMMDIPFIVRVGGLPAGIGPEDKGPFIATWKRTYNAKAFGGYGCWENKMVSFIKKENN
jgi:hypothetical protein